MEQRAKEYRDKLIEMVQETGRYITDNAEDIVDKAGYKTAFTIMVDYPQDSLPEVSVTQCHIMKNVMEVMVK